MSDISNKHNDSNNHSHHHHHHKSHHHRDESEIFKRNSFLSIKRRKAIGKYLFIFMCILAILIVAACVAVTFM